MRRFGRGRKGLLAVVVCGCAAVFAVLPAVASASQYIDRDGHNVRLRIDGKGRALLTYRKAGLPKSVLVWGAENALQPSRSRRQVKFQLDYNAAAGKGFTGNCGHYDGPSLLFLVAACKASDGSYWAVQEWPRPLPDLGYTPWTPEQRSLWMDISHWSGPTAQLAAYPDWVYSGHFHSLFGQFSYDGKPVYGFGTTGAGVPTDTYGRLIFLDTYGSTYGAGWQRENSFVSHNPTGVFCYGFYTHDPTKGFYQHPPGQTDPRGPGNGSKYRLLAIGPGVTPDVEATVTDPGDFDPTSQTNVAFRLKEWQLLSTFIGSDKQCRKGRAVEPASVAVTVQKSWFSDTPGGASVTSFTLTTPLYFNVQFAQALTSTPQPLATWVHHGYNTTRVKTTAIQTSSDGLVASMPFTLRNQNNRRYAGAWTATLTFGGLTIAEGNVNASLVPGTIVNLTQPVVTGTPTVGSTLTVSTGTWSFTPARYTYDWYRCPAQGGTCVNLSTSPSYSVTSADVGWVIGVDVTAYTAAGEAHGSGAYVGTVGG